MKFAVLITCFNRVEKTLDCLRHLYAAKLPNGYSFEVWLNDDGSTDGTEECVRQDFPSVKIIRGSGHDYWCGGMRRAWDAAARYSDYDGYFWLNDDTMLGEDVFTSLLGRAGGGTSAEILVGATCGKDGIATYGGEDESGFVVPDGGWHQLRQMNGNIVWVSRAVFKRLGSFPGYLTHALGDCDYSRRANEVGIPVFLSPHYCGICEKNDQSPAWKDTRKPLCLRLKSLYSPLGGSEPAVLFRYCLHHDGVLTAVKLLALNHLHAFFPRLWR